MNRTKKLLLTALGILLLTAAMAMPVFADGGDGTYQSSMYATFWSLVPPIVAIVLALVSKEVYISLFVGVLSGALFYAGFSPERTLTSIVDMFTEKIGEPGNVGILIFLVILGIMVSLMNKAGGSRAYGEWASRRIPSKRGAMLSTFGLGMLIFVDDYFNCLTVGSVMMPITDKYKISRAKLAYLIDATAAPICIIAPISSWAAAVTSYVPEEMNGFSLFLHTIPYNLYALLTIVMVVTMSLMRFDFGAMRRHEMMAENGDLFGGTGNEYAGAAGQEISSRGRVYDLVLPVLVLIFCCIMGMVYTGGFFEGVPFIVAFANCNASVGLVLGSLVTLLFTFLLYIPRRVITFRQFADSLPDGFRQMVPALLILSLAWTLSGFVRDALGAGEFVGDLVRGSSFAGALMPAILFLVALGLSFATGTSWGTFGILIPIATAIFTTPDASEILVISIAASLAGAVCGDHVSPISDTTIMASTGAQCNHITHVSTQLPYAMVVAAVSLVGFLLTGFIQSWLVVLPICIVLLLVALFVIRAVAGRGGPAQVEFVKHPQPENKPAD